MEAPKTFQDGQKHQIDGKTYDFFLDERQPVLEQFFYFDEEWDFGFAEGADYVYGFKQEGDTYYAIKTDILNPTIYGPPAKQAHRLPTSDGKKWIADWLRIGRKNPWIRAANDPPFTVKSFHECRGVDELLAKIRRGNWCLGQAFHLGDLCFIQQVNGGDEWLTIRQDQAFESLSVGNIIEEHGEQFARRLIDQLRSASVDGVRQLAL